MTGRYLTAQVLDDLAARLSPRDQDILKSVISLRFVTGGQLARLHFAGDGDAASRTRTARRALLRLVRLDCLTRLPRQVGGVRSGSAGFVYHAGLAGQKLAMRSGWLQSGRGRRSRSPGLAFLDHSLLVAELHTRLVEADRNERLELLELSAEPVCWRAYSGIGTQQVLKPDSFVRVGAHEWEFSYFIEVDRGTEGSRTLRRKLGDYQAYQVSGAEQAKRGVYPKVLWTVPDSARAGVIEAEIDQLAPAFGELFGVSLFEDVVNALAVPKLLTES